MSRMGLALLAAVSAVFFAGAAEGKAPPGGVDVCGPSACAHLGFADAEQFWIRTSARGVPAATVPSGFYLLRWSWSPGESDTAYLVPDARAIRWNSGPGHSAGWGGVDRSAIELVLRVASGIGPYPAPTLTRVTVGGREVSAPETYVRLLAGRPALAPAGGRWWRVTFESATPSAWTDGSAVVRLSRSHPYVSIDGLFFRLPRSVVRQARLGMALSG
jgi:hypothetical protein